MKRKNSKRGRFGMMNERVIDEVCTTKNLVIDDAFIEEMVMENFSIAEIEQAQTDAMWR